MGQIRRLKIAMMLNQGHKRKDLKDGVVGSHKIVTVLMPKKKS